MASTQNEKQSIGGGEAPLVFVVHAVLRTNDNFGQLKFIHTTFVFGDTYPYKELLKKHKFSWIPEAYTWSFDGDASKEIAEALKNAGAEVIEVLKLYPEHVVYDVNRMITELEKRGVMKDIADDVKELCELKMYNDDRDLPLEKQIIYIVNAVRKKYQLNTDFESVLKLILDGKVGEDKGWFARDRLQKHVKAYMRLKDIGLTNISVSLICYMWRIYDWKKKRGKPEQYKD